MKAIVQKGIDSILSDRYPTLSIIEKKFQTTHHRRLQQDQNWSIAATRQVLINNYWFAERKSFAVLLILFAIATTVITGNITPLKFGLDLASVAIVALVLHFLFFRLYFTFGFLPILENTVTKLRNEEQQSLIGQLRGYY